MTKTVMLPRQARGVELRAGSFDEAANTIEVCWTTGAEVQRYSWSDGPYLEALDVTPRAVRLDRLNAGAPFLNTHSSYDLSDVIGSVVPGTARLQGGEGFATIKLSGGAADADTIGKIRDGVIRNVSVGYLVHEVVKTESDDGTMPTWRVTDWEPIEISAVPIPADPGAQIRVDNTTLTPCVVRGAGEPADPVAQFRAQEQVRVKAIREAGAKLTIAADVIETHLDAGTPIEDFRALAIDLAAAERAVTPTPSTPAELSANQGDAAMSDRTNDPAATGAAPVNADTIRAEERARATELRSIGRKLKLGDAFVDGHVDAGTTLEVFRGLAIDAAAEQQERNAPGHFAPNQGASDRGQHRTYAQPKREKAKGEDATRIMMALAACRGSRRDAADYLAVNYGPDSEALSRALSVSVGSAGGFLVPPDMSSEIIELLRPASAVMALDPIMLPMPNGNMTIPGIQSGATATYTGENKPIQASQPGFGMIQLSAKKLTALVPISNDMIRFPNASAEGIVRADMVRTIAMRADLAFIRGDGGVYSPRGLRSFAAASSLAGLNVIPANVLVGSAFAAGSQPNAIQAVASVTTDLGKLELALEQANIPMTKPGWIFSPRTKTYLMNLRDGLGNLVYSAEMQRGMLRGKPFKITTQVPNNLLAVAADGTTPTVDGSEIYLADFAEVIIGEANGLELAVFDGGTYVDSDGVTQSGISNDQTVMRAIVHHDSAMRQAAAVAVLTGVRWF